MATFDPHLALHSSTDMPIFLAHSSNEAQHFLFALVQLAEFATRTIGSAVVSTEALAEALQFLFLFWYSSKLIPNLAAQTSGGTGLHVVFSVFAALPKWRQISQLYHILLTNLIWVIKIHH